MLVVLVLKFAFVLDNRSECVATAAPDRRLETVIVTLKGAKTDTMSLDLWTRWTQVPLELQMRDAKGGARPYTPQQMVQQTFTFKPDVKQQREALDLVPDMTVEALGPWIEGCGEEMLTWEGMGPAPAGGYRDILGNPSKKNLIGRSLLSSHIRSRVKLASGFFNGLRPNACRALVFEATRAGLAMLRLELDPADGGATDITGIDQPLAAEIVRNAALLVATPLPEQFQMEKLVSRLVNYEQHFQFNYKPVDGKRRTMQLDFSEKDEDIVQLVLLEDLGLVRDTELMRTTHQELWAWCDNPSLYHAL